ncbi:hypothetical protein CLOM_g1598 [Closterium sp. NIES-68]|nr:hypothetical protein CLOM_g1598 [Closterium sp. NIES-68]
MPSCRIAAVVRLPAEAAAGHGGAVAGEHPHVRRAQVRHHALRAAARLPAARQERLAAHPAVRLHDRAGRRHSGAGRPHVRPAGYVLALSSALATAAYVVIVGKLGEELQVDSFTLLLYNNCWSLPFSFLLLALNGELPAVQRVLHSRDTMFLICFVLSCASAFILNLATYLCTLINDSLTTSIVGRTKSILQGFGGLFAFGDVLVSPTNLVGLLVNSGGIGWYAVEKYKEARRRSQHMLSPGRAGHAMDAKATITRDGSQLSLVFNEVKTEDADQPDTRNGSV